MYVYFLLAHHRRISFLKIGIAMRPHERMADLQTGCPLPLTMLSTLKCQSEQQARVVEKAIHKRFKRLNTCGEWFEYTRELQQWLTGSQGHGDHEICREDRAQTPLDAEFKAIIGDPPRRSIGRA